LKDFFGWFLVVTRRFSRYSETAKIERGIYGLSMLVISFTAGLLLNIMVIFSNVFGHELLKETSLPIGELGVAITLSAGLLTIILAKITYKEKVIEFYIQKYNPRNPEDDKRQKFIALLLILVACFFPMSFGFLDWILKGFG
jgi:hypothetical protein